MHATRTAHARVSWGARNGSMYCIVAGVQNRRRPACDGADALDTPLARELMPASG